MNIRLLILAVFTFLSACGGGGGSSSSGGGGSVKPDPSKANLIVVIGDSIGAGLNASIAFPDVVSGITGIPNANSSTPGITAEEGAARAQTLIDKFNPRYIIVQLGTNDATGGGGRVDEAIAALNSLAQTCIDNGVVCIFGTLPIITASSLQNEDGVTISNGIRAIAGVRIADNAKVLNASHIGPDGEHPTDEGQQLIGETFASRLP